MRCADAAVTETLLEELLAPDRLAVVLERLLARATAERDTPNTARVAVQRQLAEVETALDRLTAAVAAGGDVPALVDAIKTQDVRRCTLQQRLKELQRAPVAFDHQLERRLRVAVTEWRGALGRQVGQARQIVTKLLKRFSNRPCTTWGGRGTSARTDAGGPMRAYSMDLRERALLDSDAGMKAADVAAKYRVSGSWVRLLKQRRRDTGEVAPRVQRQGRRGMLEPHLHTLAALMAAHPDRTRAELQDALATPASVPTVWRAVRALGLTVKKNGPPVRTRSA